MEHVEQTRFGDLYAVIEHTSFRKPRFYSTPELSQQGPHAGENDKTRYPEAAPSKIKIKGPDL